MCENNITNIYILGSSFNVCENNIKKIYFRE